MKRTHLNIKKLTLMAALTAAALIIFIIEAQVPLPIPVPGAKLGLANAITLFALFYSPKSSNTGKQQSAINLTNTNALTILLLRILVGAIITGRFLSLILSLSGGILSFAAMALTKKIVTNKQIGVCGAIGAIFHNIGQILAAMLITGTASIASYLPVLIIIGIFTGTITGFIAQISLNRINRKH